MADLYIITGHTNVIAWDENELDEVDLNQVFHRTFSEIKDKYNFIEGMMFLDRFTYNDEYTIIDEDEYKLLTT
jgi:hypothetical protein